MYDLSNYKDQMDECVLNGMREFARDMEDNLLLAGVERCRYFLEEFIEELENADGEEEALECVKNLLEDLGELNEEYNSILIETEERENLCEFISGALREVGIEMPEEIEEDLREW